MFLVRSALRSALIIAVLIVGLPAAAVPLDPPQLFVDVLFNLRPPDPISTNQFGTTTLVDSRFGAVSLTAAGTPSPSLTASADIGPSLIPSIFGSSSGVLIYGVEIVGPNGVVPVRVDAAGTASALATSGASFAVESRWDLLDGLTLLAGDDIRSGQLSGSFSQSFGRTVDVMLATNHVYSVFLLASAQAAATLAGSRATADAFVDPIFSFGLGVDPQLYAFSFSEGIGNLRAASVPEPTTLVLLGSALVGWIRLHRRRSNR